MSWGWFDICVCGEPTPAPEEEPPTPIEAPYEPGDAEYVDHVEEALGRLVWQLARVA